MKSKHVALDELYPSGTCEFSDKELPMFALKFCLVTTLLLEEIRSEFAGLCTDTNLSAKTSYFCMHVEKHSFENFRKFKI